ncbi:hypothetical protein D3C71_1653910 [compost metagenome]
MNELQAGVQEPLEVFPQPPVLVQPSKAAHGHPTLGHDLEGMQLAAFGDLHRDMSAQDLLHALHERLDRVPLSQSRLCTRLKPRLQRSSAASAPLRPVSSAEVTATASDTPWVSTAIWRLMPSIFLSAS